MSACPLFYGDGFLMDGRGVRRHRQQAEPVVSRAQGGRLGLCVLPRLEHCFRASIECQNEPAVDIDPLSPWGSSESAVSLTSKASTIVAGAILPVDGRFLRHGCKESGRADRYLESFGLN